MSASVTVGFAPAVPAPAGLAATTRPQEGGEGLFAALLALLGAGGPKGGTAPALPELPGAPGVLDLATATTASSGEGDGRPLLEALGEALQAATTASEAGEPIGPALERQLAEALDAMLAFLGAPPPAVSPVPQEINALATGDGILPAAPPADLPGDPAAPAAEGASASALPPPAGTASAPDPLAPLTRSLASLADDLATRLPELAARFETLAARLKDVALPAGFAAVLGLDPEAVADSDLVRLIETLAAGKPAAPSPAPAPFTIPALKLPEGLAAAAAPASAEAEADGPELAVRPDRPREAVPAAQPADIRPSGPSAAGPPVAAAPAPETRPDTAAMPLPSAAATVVAGARAIHAAYQAPVQQLNLPQVAFEVVRQFEAGNSRFQIRLDPPELGRIDVRLEVDRHGTVNARMVVERPETLDLMQRDQRALQQALQQAGLEASRTSLEFSLRQNSSGRDGMPGDGRGQPPFFGEPATSGDSAEVAAPATLYRGTASAGGVNLFV